MTRLPRVSTVLIMTGLALSVLVGPGCSRPQEPVETQPLKHEEKAPSAEKAIDRGLRFLERYQKADGAYRSSDKANIPIDIGITGLVVKALTGSPRGYREADGPFVSKAVQFLLSHQAQDGGIRGKMLGTYTTAIAVVALKSLQNPKYDGNIARAVKYLKGQQCNVAAGYDPKKHSTFGGYGYGSSLRPDMSNTQMVMDAFEAAGLSKDDPAYRDALVFLTRCQNSSETNDQVFAGTDGGAVYNPSESKAGEYVKPDGSKGLRSYGAMTYALLKSMIYANLSKDDQRVRAAVGWIKRNYTLDKNPGIGNAGLYYYYHTFAKALSAYGEDVITDDAGRQHDWRKELAAKLIELQRPDGSWVNEHDRWFESDPVLVTCYALLALEETTGKK